VPITHYCQTLEEALKKAKQAGKQPGCYYGGITLPNGKKGFAVYKNGKMVERYVVAFIRGQLFITLQCEEI
jgi:hypothetical protein